MPSKGKVDFLCKKCTSNLNFYQKTLDIKIKLHRKAFDIKNTVVWVGLHGKEKAEKFGLDATNELPYIKEGTLVDIQTGMDDTEYKYIYKFISSDQRTMHAIILYTEDGVSLINVYDPHYDMAFKWDESAEKRMYLNSFRSCCIHPEDKEENFHKQHHGLRHRNYTYK